VLVDLVLVHVSPSGHGPGRSWKPSQSP
jgi:hypothetical protein